MTRTGYSFPSRHRHCTRVPMSRGRRTPSDVTIVGTVKPGKEMSLADGIAKVDVVVDGAPRTVELPIAALPTNTQLVGWALVAVFPVSLEIAGVILLMAMFGAVVLARRQIDLSEDEVRVAAGLLDVGLEGPAQQAPLLEEPRERGLDAGGELRIVERKRHAGEVSKGLLRRVGARERVAARGTPTEKGGSARKLIQPLLQQAQARGQALRACPDLWGQALGQLQSLFCRPELVRNC
mgnify:CR=1 FL=1